MLEPELLYTNNVINVRRARLNQKRIPLIKTMDVEC